MKPRVLKKYSSTGLDGPEHAEEMMHDFGEHLLRMFEREGIHTYTTLLALKPDRLDGNILHLTVEVHLRVQYGQIDIEPPEVMTKAQLKCGRSRSYAGQDKLVLADAKNALRKIVDDCRGLARMFDPEEVAVAA